MRVPKPRALVTSSQLIDGMEFQESGAHELRMSVTVSPPQ